MTAVPVVRLDAIADVRLGRQRTPKDHDGPYMRPYIRAANVGWTGLLLDDVKSMNFTDHEMAVYKLQPGDLLLNEASGSVREVGKPAIWRGEMEECAFQNTLLRVRPTAVAPKYLYHYFMQQASTGAFASKSRGVGIHHLGKDALAGWPVPLPPQETQQRISAVLDQATKLCGQRAESAGMLDDFEAALFSDAFGDFAAGEPRWPLVDLGEIVADAKLGLVRGARDLGPERRYPYLRMNAIGPRGELDLTTFGRTEATAAEVKSYCLIPGDLLFNTRNSRELVGKSAVFHGGGQFLFNNNLLRLRFSDEADTEYVAAALRSPSVQRQLDARKAGTTSVFAIYFKDLRTVRLPLPPVHLQHAFAARVAAVRRHRTLLRTTAAQSDVMLTSLQHRAFAGQL